MELMQIKAPVKWREESVIGAVEELCDLINRALAQ